MQGALVAQRHLPLPSSPINDAAAFFDLDRTLLRGASGPLFTSALVDAGIVAEHRSPGIDLLYKAYDVFGESLLGMYLARRAVGYAAGWNRAAVRAAAARAAPVIAEAVVPFARPLLDEHRRAGRRVVLATTSPYDLVCPLADQLDFDDVVATRYAVDGDSYTGGLDGSFVWAGGKLAAVRRWAEGHGADLDKSWAYSDSIFDLPLLSAVAHPHAVNPDPRLWLVALARRWPVRHLDAPSGVPKVAGLEPFDLVRPVLRPGAFPYARFDIDGRENLPPEGSAILVAHSRSPFDAVALAIAAAPGGRPLRFLTPPALLDGPLVGTFARALGGLPGTSSGPGDDLQLAADALAAGQLVAVLGPHHGAGSANGDAPGAGNLAARLAAMTGAPVIPIGLSGTERVWPPGSRVPHVLQVVRPPLVRVEVGFPRPVAGSPEQAIESLTAALEALAAPD